MTPAIGSSVRITSKCTANGRAGTITETPIFWRLMGWHRVELDGPGVAWGIFPAAELEVIAASERAGLGQLGLFGGAA